jgi:hypothetical protein
LVRGVDLFASGCNFWQEELSKKKAQINERSLAVKAELSQVEPIVEDARLAVKGIKRQQLVEVNFCKCCVLAFLIVLFSSGLSETPRKWSS